MLPGNDDDELPMHPDSADMATLTKLQAHFEKLLAGIEAGTTFVHYSPCMSLRRDADLLFAYTGSTQPAWQSKGLTPYPQLREPGRCTMYGTCDPDTGSHPIVNCVNNTVAQIPNFNLSSGTNLQCPEFQDLACCNHQQFINLANNPSVATARIFFGRCPACFESFRRFFCSMNCHPSQATFLQILDTQISKKTNLSVVNHTLFTVSYDTSWTMFNSCVNVQSPALGGTVMQKLFGASNPLQWFTFLGTQGAAPLSPLQIDFIIPEFPSDPNYNYSLHRAMEPCNNTKASLYCGCNDCQPSCPFKPGPGNLDEELSGSTFIRVNNDYFDPLNLSFILGFWLFLSILLLILAYFMPHAKRLQGVQNGAYTPALSTREKGRRALYAVGLISLLSLLVVFFWAIFDPSVHSVHVDETMQNLASTVTAPMAADLTNDHVYLFNSYWEPGTLVGFFALFLFLSAVVILVTWRFFHLRRYTRPSEKTAAHHDHEVIQTGFVAHMFATLARICARYPWLVIFACLVITGLFGIGIKNVSYSPLLLLLLLLLLSQPIVV